VMASSAEEQTNSEYAADVNLAYRTLVFLGELFHRKLLPSEVDIRSLAVNLLQYQDRWATPMYIPLLGRTDLKKPLSIARPISILKDFHCIYEIEEGMVGDEVLAKKGIIEEGGKKYGTAGSKAWNKLVEAGFIKDDDAIPPKRSAFSWLKDLFEIFLYLAKAEGVGEDNNNSKDKGKGKGKGKVKQESAENDQLQELKTTAHCLAACWYYTATQVNFDEEEGGEDEDESQLPGEEQEGEEENEDEEAEDANEEEEEGKEEEEEEEEGEEEERREKRKGEEESPAIKRQKTDKGDQRGSSHHGGAEEEEEDEDADIDFNPDEGSDEDVPDEEYNSEDEAEQESYENKVSNEDEEEVTESPTTKQIRETVLLGVEALGAYIPDPQTDPIFFKRMVLKMQTVDEIEEKRWFPLGADPSQFLSIG